MTSTTVSGPAADPTLGSAGRREWIGLAVLALPTLLLALDLSVLYLALPQLSADLGASSTEQLWITDIYGFLIAGFLVTMGTLGDRIGRRKLLLIGSAAFGAASLVAAYSINPEMLIASRALMGVAGATLMPSTLALISNMFRNPKQQATAIAVWMSCFMGGMALGPVVGGVLLEAFWWGSVFLLGVPVMLVMLVVGPKFLPEYRVSEAGRRDLFSVALSLVTILSVIYGLKEFAKHGAGVVPMGAIVVGVVAGIFFVRRQLRLVQPLLDLALFKNRTFTAALSIGTLSGLMSGSLLLINLYLQVVEGLSPLQSALWLLPSAVATIASISLAPKVVSRIRPGYAIAAGLVVVAAGYAVLTQLNGPGGLALVVTGMVVSSVGVGPMAALGTGLLMGSVPPEKAGSGAAMSETSSEFGLAMGVATLGVVGTAVYRNEMAGVTINPEIPAETAAAARESIAGAANSAQQLPPDLGTELLAGAQTAFAHGLGVATTISAGLALLLAVVAATLLRHVPAASSTSSEAPDHGALDEAAEENPVTPTPVLQST